MAFFRRLRRFLALVCLGLAGLLVCDEPAASPAASPSFSPAQSFLGESPDGVSVTAHTPPAVAPADEPPGDISSARTTAPPPPVPPLPAPPAPVPPGQPEGAIARALVEQNRALQSMITTLNGALEDLQTRLKASPPVTGIAGVPVGAGRAMPLPGGAAPVAALKTQADRLRSRIDQLDRAPLEPARPWKGLVDRPSPARRPARAAELSERLLDDVRTHLFPAPPALDRMRLNARGLEIAARGDPHQAR